MTDDQAPPTQPAARPPEPDRHEPPRRSRAAAVAGRLALAGLMFGVMFAGIWAVAELAKPPARPMAEVPAAAPVPVTPADVEPGVAAPSVLAVPQAAPGQDPVQAWIDQVTATVDIPARALTAYVYADLTLRTELPACRLSWATLAAIGRIESDHGRHGGAVLGADGRPSRPITGLPLDGREGVREIRDTDGGELDGDDVYDRAVGPMQFIPGTWAKWGADGNSDGLADPQNIDDAALSAGRYLCSGDRNTATGEGWWAAVLAYNRSVDYGQRVFGVADQYARSVS